MTTWRMAMRHGEYGKFAHTIYIPIGVGAITYHGVEETDFTDISLKDAKQIWQHLAATQKASLKHLCYDMAGGDAIFVKAGPMIVTSGIVRGAIGERAYRFNYAKQSDFGDSYEHWFQQVPVVWRTDFMPIRMAVGSNQRHAIQEISAVDARRTTRDLDQQLATAPLPSEVDKLLRTESYLRATSASMRVITPRHNSLSNHFKKWLDREHSIKAKQEQAQVDVRFLHGKIEVLAELKICDGGSTRHAIREALGQLLEYNYYPTRTSSKEWLIVLDAEPSDSDRRYVNTLRDRLRLPLYVGWRSEPGFAFSPGWPA
jgi:hypothetical protein